MKNSLHKIFTISNEITAFPVIHKSILWTTKLKEHLLNNKYDCIVIDLPNDVKNEVINGVLQLPEIGIVYYKDDEGDSVIIPIDPCEPTIEAVSYALQENIPLEFIDSNISIKYSHESFYPDNYAVRYLSSFEYLLTLMPKIIDKYALSETDYDRLKIMSGRLFNLSIKYNKILFLTDFIDLIYIKEFVNNFDFVEDTSDRPSEIGYKKVKEDQLYFVLGELPYITKRYISNSLDIFSENFKYEDTFKELISEAKQEHDKVFPEDNLSISKLNNVLKFARNLSLKHNRLFPDLFTLLKAAKLVVNDDFALQLLVTAKDYGFNKKDYGNSLTMYPETLKFDPEEEPEPYYNFFDTTPKHFNNIILEPRKKKLNDNLLVDSKRLMNLVSYPPEDIFIENFAKESKEDAKQFLVEESVSIEKFVSSFEDGLAIKETITSLDDEIFVKVFNKKLHSFNIDTTIVIFDSFNDDIYRECGVLYAEHHNESTLSYFSTPFTEFSVAKGIFKAEYGGFALKYPPKFIPDFWHSHAFPDGIETRSEQLIYSATLFSETDEILYMANEKPSEKIKAIFKSFNKKMVYIPLRKIGQKKIEKLKTFHILENLELRKIAHRFIGKWEVIKLLL